MAEITKEKLQEILKKTQIELAKSQAELEKFKITLVMCASCHKIRDKQDVWHPVADYLHNQLGIMTTHSICPDCAKKLYPEFYKG